jgi:hypothetical protein
LEKYAEAQGVKKAFVIEEALLHHLQALNELPADIVIPPRLIVSRTSGERVLERIEKPELHRWVSFLNPAYRAQTCLSPQYKTVV